jgi:hypothetical protein
MLTDSEKQILDQSTFLKLPLPIYMLLRNPNRIPENDFRN